MVKEDISSLVPSSKGHYVLVLHLETDKSIRVGCLGSFVFRSGYYCYVGSALGPGGLSSRVGRHVRGPGRARWHVDYLREQAVPVQVWLVATEKQMECRIAKSLGHLHGAVMPAARFGSSDCSCPSHLFYFPFPPDFEHFACRLRKGRWPQTTVKILDLE